MTKHEIKTELKWNTIFFSTTLVWMVLEIMKGWHGAKIAQHANYSILYNVLYIFLYLCAFWDNRREAGIDHFNWKQGFKFGMFITIIITLLSPLVQTIIHKIISPD